MPYYPPNPNPYDTYTPYPYAFSPGPHPQRLRAIALVQNTMEQVCAMLQQPDGDYETVSLLEDFYDELCCLRTGLQGTQPGFGQPLPPQPRQQWVDYRPQPASYWQPPLPPSPPKPVPPPKPVDTPKPPEPKQPVKQKDPRLETLAWYQKLYFAKIDIDNDQNYYGYPGADEDREKIKRDGLEYNQKAKVLMSELAAEGVSWAEIDAALDKGESEGRAM